MRTASAFTRRFALREVRSGLLQGLRFSIKELLDVEGYPTPAGTVLLDRVAERDAPAVARLRAAGARLMGHTCMTELAYSGLGLNPHHGTPDNPLRPGRIPGGSTSGGAVSVATGEADVAIGTDTGGSLRIPAAFCGLVGFKPTARTVPREGCVPLSPSLDSIGPIARTIEACERAWRIMADRPDELARAGDPGALPLVLPTDFGRDDWDEEVADGFALALAALRESGVAIEERAVGTLDDYRAHAVWHYAAVEARAAHPELWERRERLDPRVASRMARADAVSAIDYAATLMERERLIASFPRELGQALLVLPTVAVAPPRFEQLERDEDYDRLNLLALRNTTLANVVDGCSVSLPAGRAGTPVGVMLVGPGGADERLLAAARALEPIVRPAGEPPSAATR